ncbi:MAG: hypothetical protein WCK49_10010 [Myxococcaceae bacterium]
MPFGITEGIRGTVELAKENPVKTGAILAGFATAATGGLAPAVAAVYTGAVLAADAARNHLFPSSPPDRTHGSGSIQSGSAPGRPVVESRAQTPVRSLGVVPDPGTTAKVRARSREESPENRQRIDNEHFDDLGDTEPHPLLPELDRLKKEVEDLRSKAGLPTEDLEREVRLLDFQMVGLEAKNKKLQDSNKLTEAQLTAAKRQIGGLKEALGLTQEALQAVAGRNAQNGQAPRKERRTESQKRSLNLRK